MKNLITIILILIPLLSTAQQVEDFAKIRIPAAFSDFNENQYQMNQYLRMLLKKKGYEVFSENNKKNKEIYDPCEVLLVDIKDESSWFKTKLNVEFKDCRGNLIANYKGDTRIKELKEGHIDALNNAINSVGLYNGKAYSSTITQEERATNNQPKKEDKSIMQKVVDGTKEAVEVVVEEVKEVTKRTSKKITNGAIYTDGFRDYQLTKKNNVISLKDLNLNTDFATLYPTRNEEVYQAKFADESSAVGYIDAEKIILEKYNEQGEKQELTLKRK